MSTKNLLLSSQLDKDLESIAAEFEGVFSRETVARYLQEAAQAFASAKVSNFLPIIVRRFAREQLRALGQAQGVIVKEVPEVLFVCVHNAGRSQMAAALMDHHAKGKVHVRSGGSAPGAEINPAVIEVMNELGIDMSQEFPKPVTDEGVQAADAVITMGCGDACPIYPGKRYEDWPLDDPFGQSAGDVRKTRDEIDRRVQALLAELTNGRPD